MTHCLDAFPPTREAALARLADVRPAEYARSRNAIEGAVTQLSPYITHGLVTLPEVLANVAAKHPMDLQHKFVFELGWREYFRHVWHHRGAGILTSLHPGVLPEQDYVQAVPEDIRQARTGLPVIDMAVRSLYATGTLHNHARMWLASYVVHLRKVHWRAGADWLYAHLLDGDLASNHLSWQWVAGTGSHKPYLFNADNVARYAPAAWHSPGSVVDASYEVLDHIARQSRPVGGTQFDAQLAHQVDEPAVFAAPLATLGLTQPSASVVQARDVWLVHPWSLGELPNNLPENTLVIGLFVAEFHRDWLWSERRWNFVATRMANMTAQRWFGNAADIGAALKGARQVRSIGDPHLAPWLSDCSQCETAPALFPLIDQRCDSFSQWWTRVSRNKSSVASSLLTQQSPLW